jgi:hypothetical protein
MQCNSVTLAIDNNGTKSEWTDGMFRLDNFAAVRCDRRNGIIQSAVGVQVDHRALSDGFSSSLVNKHAPTSPSLCGRRPIVMPEKSCFFTA